MHSALASTVLLGVLAVAGCGGNDIPDPPGTEVRSGLERNNAPDVSPADLETQVAGNTAFALDLYQQVRAQSDGNLFFSPHSIEVALAMTWAGARNQTETDMASALHFDLPQDALHRVFDYIDLELGKRGEGAEGTDGKGFRLNVVNAIWGQVGYEFLADFLDVLALNYGAGLRLLDFVADAAGATEEINTWVEEATEGRIEDLIPPGALTEYTKLVLVNAIYFNAAWATPFEEESTADGAFHTAGGQTVQVPMMHGQVEAGYWQGDGYEAVELPYDGGELSMVIVAPDEGTLATFEEGFAPAFLDGLAASEQYGLVTLTMPRWELDGETVSLKQVLAALGMEIAFSPAADFTGMHTEGGLMIHDVLHQAFVKVNEAGTEAAAATAVIVGDTSAPPEGPTIVLDRPFIYLIKDLPTGQILFVGRVTNPS